MDYRNHDWPYAVPDPEALARDWGRTVVAAIEVRDPRLVAVADTFRATLDEDSVQLAQFSIDAAPAIAWALARNRWLEFDLLARLFAHPAVKAALPAVQAPDAKTHSFVADGFFTGLGRLADRIIEAGPYVEFPGSAEDALDLALNFMRGVCDLGFSETVTFFTRDAWTDWFFARGPDASFVWFNMRFGIVTVLLLTGTD